MPKQQNILPQCHGKNNEQRCCGCKKAVTAITTASKKTKKANDEAYLVPVLVPGTGCHTWFVHAVNQAPTWRKNRKVKNVDLSQEATINSKILLFLAFTVW